MSCFRVGTKMLAYIQNMEYFDIKSYYSCTESYFIKGEIWFTLPPISVVEGGGTDFMEVRVQTINCQYLSFNYNQRLRCFI